VPNLGTCNAYGVEDIEPPDLLFQSQQIVVLRDKSLECLEVAVVHRAGGSVSALARS
jgi:hypothetical protein